MAPAALALLSCFICAHTRPWPNCCGCASLAPALRRAFATWLRCTACVAADASHSTWLAPSLPLPAQAQEVMATEGYQANDMEAALKQAYLRMDELLVKARGHWGRGSTGGEGALPADCGAAGLHSRAASASAVNDGSGPPLMCVLVVVAAGGAPGGAQVAARKGDGGRGGQVR